MRLDKSSIVCYPPIYTWLGLTKKSKYKSKCHSGPDLSGRNPELYTRHGIAAQACLLRQLADSAKAGPR